MARNKRPRKPYRPRGVDLDVVPNTIARACALPQPSQDKLYLPALAALANFGDGHGSSAAWCDMADCMNVAEALAELRVLTAHADMFQAAQAALHGIFQRGQGSAWTITDAEAAAVRDALWFYRAQLIYCAQGEMVEAIERVKRRKHQALQGNASPDAIVCVGGLGQTIAEAA